MEGVREAEFREVWSTGLYPHAREGNVAQARKDFARLEGRNWINFETIALMLHATAVKGLVKETIGTFEQFFPRRAQLPQLTLHGGSIRSRSGGGYGPHPHMAQEPDAYTYVTVLKGFASSADISSFSDLLGRMKSKSSKNKPSLHGYTTAISFLA